MEQEINVTAQVHCEGSQGDSYRLYLGKDLLTERTWRWAPDQIYLIETAPVKLAPGQYDLRIERVEPANSTFTLTNLTAEGATVNNQRIIVE